MESDEAWKGQFGDEYNIRNSQTDIIAHNTALFAKMSIKQIDSAIEFGCGYGYALLGLKGLFSQLELTGVEINQAAAAKALAYGIIVYNQSIRDFIPTKQYDFVLTKGMLMYIPEEEIEDAYKILYESSRKYICICEYYNPSLVELNHRGIPFYKRDYGKIMDLYPDLQLIDYGFVYHKDTHPQDDVNWFLFQKLTK